MNKRDKRARFRARASNVVAAIEVSFVALVVAFAVTRTDSLYVGLCYVSFAAFVSFILFKLIVL